MIILCMGIDEWYLYDDDVDNNGGDDIHYYLDDGIIICIDMVLDRFNSYMRVFHKPNLLGEKSYFAQGF